MDVFMYTTQVNIYVYVDTSSKAVFLCLGIVMGSVNPRVLGWVANGSGSG